MASALLLNTRLGGRLSNPSIWGSRLRLNSPSPSFLSPVPSAAGSPWVCGRGVFSRLEGVWSEASANSRDNSLELVVGGELWLEGGREGVREGRSEGT